MFASALGSSRTNGRESAGKEINQALAHLTTQGDSPWSLLGVMVCFASLRSRELMVGAEGRSLVSAQAVKVSSLALCLVD